MVSPVGYRNPALLARMAASLDHISSGRMNFGFGAGGYKPEYKAYGFEFIDKPSIRLAQMKEALQLILGLWTQPRLPSLIRARRLNLELPPAGGHSLSVIGIQAGRSSFSDGRF